MKVPFNRFCRARDRWLLSILLLALGLRTYHIAYPPWDYHNWRQTMTLMVARDFARHLSHLLSPQVQWVGPGGPTKPSYFSGEFSIMGLLAAVLYRLFGESETLARVVVIAFSLSGTYFLYRLLYRRAGPVAARIGGFIYTLLPYHLFFGRAFMPDIPALSLALGGLLFLDLWTEDRCLITLLASATLMALAVLQKLTVVFVGLPVLYLFWLAHGRHLVSRLEVYAFAAIVSMPSYFWYRHASAMAHKSGFAIMQPGLFGHSLGLWLRPDFLHQVFSALSFEGFSPVGLGLFILGLFWPGRSVAFSLFRFWTVGAVLLLLLIPDVVLGNYYYLSLLLPGGAALGALALTQLAPNRTAYPLLVLFLTVFAVGAIWTALPLYQHDRAPRDLAMVLNRLTSSQDLIAAETGGSPNLLYFADRRGWFLTQQYEAGLLQELAKKGALYYGDPSTSHLAERPKFFREMDDRFERLTPDQGPWPIYRLAAPTGPYQQLPERETQNALNAKFDDQVELLSCRIQKLTDSPTSFELLSFWRYMGNSALDLSIFLQLTGPENEVVHQASYRFGDYKVLTTLQAGEIVRERKIVVLPGSLRKAKYRIWAGCFEGGRMRQLAVHAPGVAQQQNFVHIGDIEIPAVLSYGWFSAN